MRDFSGIAKTEVFTLQDLVHRLRLRSMSKPGERQDALLARAIQDAVRGLPGKHQWKYFRRQTRFRSSPPKTFSVVYNHSRGTYPRLITITSGGTWPADSTHGEVSIGGRRYRIAQRITALQATLEADFALRGDFTGEMRWERRSYQFPREIEKVHNVQNLTRGWPVSFNPSPSFHQDWSHSYVERGGHYDAFVYDYNESFAWQNHGGRFGSAEFVLSAAPYDESSTYEICATMKPHIPEITTISGVGAAGSQGQKTVVCPDGQFIKKYIGTVLRIGWGSAKPEAFESNDYKFQAFVMDVPDATTLTISEPLPESLNGRGYVLSSPMDIEASIMLEYIEDEAYHQYTKNHDHKSYPVAKMAARESLLQAIARDNRVSLNSHLWNPYSTWTNGWGGMDETLPEGESPVSGEEYFLAYVPGVEFGEEGDVVYITSGNLQGAQYEKREGVWTYLGIYELAMRSADPETEALPVGFQWRLANQADPTLNGIWEWDGVTIYQRVQE